MLSAGKTLIGRSGNVCKNTYHKLGQRSSIKKASNLESTYIQYILLLFHFEVSNFYSKYETGIESLPHKTRRGKKTLLSVIYTKFFTVSFYTCKPCLLLPPPQIQSSFCSLNFFLRFSIPSIRKFLLGHFLTVRTI